LTHPTNKLVPKRYGPFLIKKEISPVMFKIELPRNWKIYDIFHTLLLSPYKETEEHRVNYPEPPPDLIEDNPEYEVEQVLASRHFGR
jgi:hypothetical protein